jgi:general secretion pathway protein E
MDAKVGLTFGRALRNILRQDFNIVMVGEIRDLETAEAAFEFASTGRLAFSTLHTNSAAGAITRLRDMGVETYMMASTLRAVMAQRLVRKLCDVCKTPIAATPAHYHALDMAPGPQATLYEPVGCMACGNSGFHGRIAIYELLVVDPTIRALLHANATEDEIDRAAFANHHRLIENARRHVFTGETSIAEVLRVCRKEARDGGL